MSETLIRIFTDGSCSPNPGPGGWAAVLIFAHGNRVVELSGNEVQTTNNRMELTAALKALQSLDQPSDVEIITDSKYLQRGVVEWYAKWSSNDWRTFDGRVVKNSDLWKDFACELNRHRIHWSWTKGHCKDHYNEQADRLAGEARKALQKVSPTFDPQGVHLYLGVTWRNSSRSGAWAVILNYRNSYKVIGDYLEDTTANNLYLHGVISGIDSLTRVLPVYVHTRSGYVRDGLEQWLDRWQRNNWCTREDCQVSNAEQWQQLASLKKKYPIRTVKPSDTHPLCLLDEAKELAREFEDYSLKC